MLGSLSKLIIGSLDKKYIYIKTEFEFIFQFQF